MSWWDINPAGDVIGDGAADVFDEDLARLAEERAAVDGEAPSLAGLLAGLGEALAAHEGHPVVVVAKTTTGEVRGDGADAEAEGRLLGLKLAASLAELDRIYQERWERPPNPTEVAAAAAFVVGPEPGRYLRGADADDLDLEDFAIEEPGS